MNIVRVVSLVSLLSCVSVLKAQSFTTDVAPYLAKRLQLEYTSRASSDSLKCNEAPPPGAPLVYFYCQGGRDNMYVGIGAKQRDFLPSGAHRHFSFMMRAVAGLPSTLKDSMLDRIDCPEEAVPTGVVYHCKVTYDNVRASRKTLHFSVFYPKTDLSTHEPFVLASDNFKQGPEMVRSIVLEYQRLIKPITP